MPPQAVDELPARLYTRIPAVTAMVEQLRRDEQERAARG